jgi:cytochrome c oxidase assembly protein Cox11
MLQISSYDIFAFCSDFPSFCFQVEMPVFFYLDPDLLDDPRMANVDDIVLSYTFFSSKDQEIKYPGQQIIPATG